MAVANAGREKMVKTFSETDYFAKGTYKRDLVELFSTVTVANLLTKTILAPLERWRIIKQTQPTYELRPIKFTSFPNYISSTPISMQRCPPSRVGRHCGGVTKPTSGCTAGRCSDRSSCSTQSNPPSTSLPSKCRMSLWYNTPN